MKVYTLLKKLADPCKPIMVYGNGGTLLYKGVVNNVPWHIAKCECRDTWESNKNVTWVKLKG